MVIPIRVPMSTPLQPQQTSPSSQPSGNLSRSKNNLSLLTLCHLLAGLQYRTWYFSIVFILGGIGKQIGVLSDL